MQEFVTGLLSRLMQPQSYEGIVKELGDRIYRSLDSQPITLMGIETGGVVISQDISEYLATRGVNTKQFSIRVNKDRGVLDRRTLEKHATTYLRGRELLIVDDAVWSGKTYDATYGYMERNRERLGIVGKPVYVVIIDALGKADISHINIKPNNKQQ